MRGGFAFSIGVHALILLLMLLGLPFLRPKPREMPPMISVQLIEMGKQTTTNKISAANKVEEQPKDETPPPPPKPQPAPEPTPAPAPPPPPPHEALDSAMPALPAVDNAVPDLEAPAANLKKRLQPMPELASVDSKVADLQPPAKVALKRPEPKQPQESFDAVLKNLSKLKPQEQAPQQPTEAPTKVAAKAPTGAQAPLSDKLTASEMDALGQQLRHCWNMPAAAKDAQNLAVDLDVVVNPDRTVSSVQIVDQARLSTDPAFRAAAMSAARALRMPQCTPLALPPDKYQEWQSMTLHFDPKEMLGQ